MNSEKRGSDSPGKNDCKDDEEGVVLPGFRFHPTDEELVGFYLRRKVEKKPLSIELIKQIDIYKYDPWDLPKVSTVGDKEWYFFCIRGRKYRNSIRPNRVTGSGFWKATGIDKPIYSSTAINHHHHDCMGLKKSLVYYRGSAGKGTKTDWMMHEFRLPPSGKAAVTDPSPASNVAQEAEVWTLCRIFKRVPSHRKYTPTMKNGNFVNTRRQNNLADSSSKTSSYDSECTEQYVSFGDSLNPKHTQTRNPIAIMGLLEERSHAFMNPLTSSFTHQAPFTTAANYPSASFRTVNGDQDFFNYGNWDELRSVVERAIDPFSSLAYDCQ